MLLLPTSVFAVAVSVANVVALAVSVHICRASVFTVALVVVSSVLIDLVANSVSLHH